MEAKSMIRQQAEIVSGYTDTILYDLNIVTVDDTELIVNSNGYCHNFSDLNKLEAEARQLLRVIDNLRKTFDTGEFNRWMNAINEERALIRKEDEEDLWKRRESEKQKSRSNTQIYLMLNQRSGHYKIGRATDANYRERTLQAEEPQITLVKAYTGKVADEKALHKLFADKRLRGEWFALTEEDITQFHSYFNDK